jgi:hypothetical protein
VRKWKKLLQYFAKLEINFFETMFQSLVESIVNLNFLAKARSHFNLAANFCWAKKILAWKTQFFAKRVRLAPVFEKPIFKLQNHLKKTNDLIAFD